MITDITMGSWLIIASNGNPLPPDKYEILRKAGLICDGVITDNGHKAMTACIDAAIAQEKTNP